MKHPGGRPTKYEERFCEMLIDHMKQGLSFEAFGGAIGVSKDTLYRWLKRHVEFSDAKKIATQYSQLFWEQQALNGLFDQKDKKLNSTVWIFNMKNRFGWRDRIETENLNKEISIKISEDEEDL